MGMIYVTNLFAFNQMMIAGLINASYVKTVIFNKNYPLKKISTLQQIRWYQWENAGKKQLENVLKETLIDNKHDLFCAQSP